MHQLGRPGSGLPRNGRHILQLQKLQADPIRRPGLRPVAVRPNHGHKRRQRRQRNL